MALPGLPAPTGNVVFRDGADVIGAVPLRGSAAAVTTTFLSSGNHTLSADYVGDGNHNPSSGSLPFTVGGGESNVTAAQARSISIDSMAGTRVGGTAPPVWYRTQLFANRSYQFSAWPVADDGATGAVQIRMDIFSDSDGTIPVSPAARSAVGGLEGSPNEPGGMNPETQTFQPTSTVPCVP